MSEFGTGFAYCLGLFLAHAERPEHAEILLKDYSLWFNAAGDHLFDLCTDPEILGEELAERTKTLKDFVLHRRLAFDDTVTKADKFWAIQEAKNLLLLWDEQMKIPSERGQYE